MFSRRRLLASLKVAIAGSICAVLTACSQVPDSKELVEVAQPGPVVVKADQTIRFGERITGLVRDVDAKGNYVGEPVADLEVALGGRRGMLDMIVVRDRTYASWVSTADRVVVGELVPNSAPRMIWEGPTAAADHLGGALEMSPTGRLTIALGDMQRPEVAANPDRAEGKIVSLSPDGGPGQLPNIISRGWVDPGGIAYDGSGKLWIAEGNAPSRLTRVSEGGAVGKATELAKNSAPADLESFGPAEFLVCERNTRKLERYLIKDGVEAIPGREVATNCAGSVAEMSDGRVVYATDTSLRITSD